MGKERLDARMWIMRPSGEEFKHDGFTWYKVCKCMIQLQSGDSRDPTFNTNSMQMKVIIRKQYSP